MRAKGRRSIATLSATPWYAQWRRHLDAERGDLAEAAERIARVGQRPGKRRVAERIVEPHVDAGRAGHAVAGDAVALEHLQQRCFEAEHVLLDVMPSRRRSTSGYATTCPGP